MCRLPHRLFCQSVIGGGGHAIAFDALGPTCLFVLGKRVLGAFVLDPERRTGQFEYFHEMMFEKSCVGSGDAVERIAMNHDDWRVTATLMRIPQLWAEQAVARWRLLFDGRNQCAGEFGRGHFCHCCSIGFVDRTQNSADTRALERRNMVHSGKTEKI